MPQLQNSSKNKVALITGASRGIGASTALLLAKNNYDVAINYLENKDKAEEVANQARKFGVKAIVVKADLGSEQEIVDMFLTIDGKLGAINALVNNGGISSGSQPIEKIDFNYLEKIYKTNVFGVFICCREAIKRMKQENEGAIVNVSSLAAKLGGFKMSAYASSKAAISNFTIGLSKEVAEFGIRVNDVAPGAIDTDTQKGIPENRLNHLNNSIPLKRMGTAREVAEAIFWLLSNKSSYVTGSTLSVTGGK
jgi:NAD(P)-dependent dehydrogenase (short-subunit alcohol dehydrogenase family)